MRFAPRGRIVMATVTRTAISTRSHGGPSGVPREVICVWALFAVVTAEILVTYSRLPAAELYRVSASGLGGGLSRALVFVNFPLALAAIALVAFVFQRLTRQSLQAAAAVSVLLSAAVFWPGVVSEANLDARSVNALAALGVFLALVLTFAAVKRDGLSSRSRRRGDLARVTIALLLAVLALPWMAADLGFFLNGVPVLGSLYQTGAYARQLPGQIAAVHHGHHHGMDGFLLALSALILSRALVSVTPRYLRTVLTGYLALMLVYGIANLANDVWDEQVVKRGWTTWQIPDVVVPSASVPWAIIVAVAVALWAAFSWAGRRDLQETDRHLQSELRAPYANGR
jgi:hypothetical protein